MARYFQFPWAVTGDRTAVPFPTDPGGDVSVAQGFGPAYEIAPGQPGWKPVPREETNGYLYDITDNIRQYQLNGAPEWYSASDNNGVAISYPLNAIVRRNDLVYRSLVAANTVEPGTDPTRWAVDGVAAQASTSVVGITRYATPAEAAARTISNAAVTPAGLGSLFNLLLNQPIFPEVEGNGLFTVTSPATGQVRIAAGTGWTHRGAFSYTSAQTDLLTVASKTYHLRWDRVNGFALYDLSSGSYNPSAVAETDAAFDTTYDSMLIARVVTSSGNTPTITALVNKNRLYAAFLEPSLTTRTSSATAGGLWAMQFTPPAINWARTPAVTGSASRSDYTGTLSVAPEEPKVVLSGTVTDGTGSLTASVSRYSLLPTVTIDVNSPSTSLTFGVQLSMTAAA